MEANDISRQWFAFRLQVDRDDGPVVPSGSLQLSRVQQSRVIRIRTVIESVLNLSLIYEPWNGASPPHTNQRPESDKFKSEMGDSAKVSGLRTSSPLRTPPILKWLMVPCNSALTTLSRSTKKGALSPGFVATHVPTYVLRGSNLPAGRD